MGVASRVAAWGRRFPRHSAAAALTTGSSTGNIPGVPILLNTLGLAGPVNLVVEFAWGVNITSDSSQWTWTDVTADVKHSNAVAITIGRSDESANPQPAQAAFTLDNRASAYSYGPVSPNYPNVKRNVPCRISLWYLGVRYTRFFGYALFAPSWDSTGNFATVAVTAYGAKRRLAQASTPVASALTRSTPSLAGLEQYWPCEDGTAAQFLAPGITGGVDLFIDGTPSLASNSVVQGSNAIPTMNTGSFTASFQTASTQAVQVRCICVLPPAASAAPDQSVIFRVFTNGSIVRWDLLYRTSGNFSVSGYDANGTKQYDSGTVAFSVDGKAARMGLYLQQSGSDVVGQIQWYTVNAPTAGFTNLTATGQSITNCTGVWITPNEDQPNIAIGQVTIQNTVTSIFDLLSQTNAYNGEYTGNRLDRLAAENGEYLSRLASATYQTMGPQTPNTFLGLVQGCADVELGYLYDGVSQGLAFIAQDQITSLAAAMTLDASLGQPAQPLTPVDDDYLTVNQFTASRTNGSSYTYADMVSPLSTVEIGEYAQSAALPFFEDGEQLSDYASWKVGAGTVPGYRWTPLLFWIHRDPELLAVWLKAGVMSRVDITNLSAVRSQFPSTPESTLVQGYTETIDQFLYTVSCNTSPYAPWRVGEFAADTGDSNPYLLRADTDGSTVTQAYAAGATSIQVATAVGFPVWTTNSDDCPLQINVQGYPVTVTAITGSSSPQTFTVSALPVAVPANASISLWQPTLLDVIGF